MNTDIFHQQAANGKRWCYDCGHYHEDCFGGYNASVCSIHGSLDCDQRERHPDITADTCKDYIPNGKSPWYESF